MPIRPYLNGRTFPPETIVLMGAALDEVCRVLQVGLDVGSRRAVARRIIALVEEGKIHSDQLAVAVINEMRGTDGAPA
jgi:hypothetical protein